MSRRLPGFRWRTLAHNEKTGECIEQSYQAKDNVCFDELVIDDWFHIEQMDVRFWWLGIRDLNISIWVKADKSVEVQIENESEYAPPGEPPVRVRYYGRNDA